jgi:DNA-binding SARP family transcriptional activator
MPASYVVKVLGPPRVATPGGEVLDVPAGKPLALLVFLVRNPAGVSRSELAELFWPGRPRARARASLRQALWVLRRELGEEIFPDDDPVRLAAGRVTSDLDEVETALGRGEVDAALARWEAPPFHHLELPELSDWSRWADRERLDLERRLGAILVREARRALDEARPEAAVRRLRSALEVTPHRRAAQDLLVGTLLELRHFQEAEDEVIRQQAGAEGDEGRLAELEETLERIRTVRRGAPGRDGDHGTGVRLPFVGRQSEYSALLRLWRAARRGQTRSAAILGPPGIGRTRLVQEVGLAVRTRGARGGLPASSGPRVVHVEAGEGDGRIDWAMARKLVRSLITLSGAAGISPASDRILRTLSPSLALASGGDGMEVSGLGTPPGVLVADALIDLVTAVSEDGPLLLILDNVHGFDEPSREVITHLVREVEDAAILFLLTGRTADGESPHHPAAALLNHRHASRTQRLGPWSQEETTALVRELARGRHGEPLVEAVGRRLHGAARGHPLRSREILEGLRDAGVLVRDPGTGSDDGWLLDIPAVPMELPGTRGGGRGSPLPGTAVLSSRHGKLLRRAGLAVAAALFVALLPPLLAPSETAPRFGGGTLVLMDGTQPILYSATSGSDEGWTVRAPEVRVTPGTSTLHPVVEANGAIGWFGSERSTTGKPWVSRLVDGRAEPIHRTLGDDYLRDVSPDGRWALVASEPRDGEGYRHDLYLRDLVADSATLLLEGRAQLHRAVFSPRGGRIAVLARGAPDSLLVLTPRGDRTLGIALPHPASDLRWCPDPSGLVLMEDGPEGERLFRVDPENGDRRPHPQEGFVGSGVACSPDGSAIAYVTAVEGEVIHLVHDLVDGSVERLEVPSRGRWTAWLPPAPRAIPSELVLHLPDSSPRWGETVRVESWIRFTDGSWGAAEDLTWRSASPSVASVSPEGVLHANGPGRTVLSATWDGWLEGEVPVKVTGDAAVGALLHDPLWTLEPRRWRQVGWPPSRVVQREGERVVLLAGDALHLDGILSREARAFPRGATVEVEFRLPLTRRDKQWFLLCLFDGDVAQGREAGAGRDWASGRDGGAARDVTAGGDRVDLTGAEIRDRPCLRYPRGELARFDPGALELRATSQFPGTKLDASHRLPSSDWVHVALGLRADGHLSAYLNRELVGSAPVRVQNGPDTRWRVLLLGSSWETEVLVRNLTVWEGLRYEH